MTPNPVSLDDLKALFEAGTTAAADRNVPKKNLTAVLDGLDAIASGVKPTSYFTPANRTCMDAYYEFLSEWHDNRAKFGKKLHAHYDSTIRKLTALIFDWTMTGLLIEAMDPTPNLPFLDACLEDLVILSCDAMEEPQRPFFCVPSNLQATALEMMELVKGLDMPEDIEFLLERFERLKALRQRNTYITDAETVQ